jgi:hypothetical protein
MFPKVDDLDEFKEADTKLSKEEEFSSCVSSRLYIAYRLVII